MEGLPEPQPRRRLRQLPALRRARVRHERDHERRRPARRLHSLWRHLPDLHGIRAQRRAHVGADEAARALRVHPRLHRSGRRRPDPPADRAAGQPARHAEPRHLASVRRGRVRGGLEVRHRAQRRPERADLQPPEPAAPGARRPAAGRRGPRRLRAQGLRRRAGADPDRHRFGSGPGRSGVRQADRAGPQGACRVDAEHQRVRRPGRGLQAVRTAAASGCPHRHRSGSRRLLVQVRGPRRPCHRHDHLR
ncbi:hypothetical protein D3C81_1514710 [compost metagenome]